MKQVPGRGRWRLRRVAPIVAMAMGLLLATRGVAWAHAQLLKSDPAAGSRLGAVPPQVRLLFSEEMEASMTSISLTGSDGHAISLHVRGDPHDVHAVIGDVDVLPNDTWVVTWHALSADGHPVHGTFPFILNVTEPAKAPTHPAPVSASPADDMEDMSWGPALFGAPVVPSLLRGGALAALFAFAGLLAFLGWEAPAARPRHVAVIRAVRAVAVASIVLLLLHACAWAMNAMPDHHLTADMGMAVMHTGTGGMEEWRIGLAVVSAVAFALGWVRTAAACAFLALIVSGGSGHAAALSPLVATPAKAVHLMAGAAWLGGLLWLLLCDRTDGEGYLRWVHRVSGVALGTVALVAFSGLVQAWLFLPTVASVATSAYGAVTLLKTAGLLVLVGFGAYHRYRVIPSLPQDAVVVVQFSATLRREVAIMVVVMLLGGLLAYMPPPPRVAAMSPFPSHPPGP